MALVLSAPSTCDGFIQCLQTDLILEKIWGLDFIGDSKTVDVHIRWLREKIEVQPSAPELIRTVRGFGYRFG